MVKGCCVYGCDEKFIKGGSVTFHKFPKDQERRETWKKNISKQQENFKATYHMFVCSKHFTADCFTTKMLGRTWLKDDAVPTVFCSFPTYLQSETANKRKISTGTLEKNDPLTDEFEPTTDVESNTADGVITVKQEIPEIVQHPPCSTMPVSSEIPIITFTTSLNQIEKTPTENGTHDNLESGSNSKKTTEININGTKDCDTRKALKMICSSQRVLKKEMKCIKKLMIRISDQNRKRIEQENEKIQLKKMKLMLKCIKQGVDYYEFITEFM